MSHTISDDLLRRFDIPGPRYTSYPTADRFVEAFTEQDYVQALEQRKAGSMALPLSLYVHIPFCESVCYYCACNKVITKHHERAAEYLRYLAREVELQVAHCGHRAQRVAAAPGRRHADLPVGRRAGRPDEHAALAFHAGARRRILDRGGPAHRDRSSACTPWRAWASTA